MKSINSLLICLSLVFVLILSGIPVTIEASDGQESTENSRSSSRGLKDNIWPAFRGDFARTGNTTAEGLSYYNLGWSKNIGIYWSSPVVHYDQIYVASPNRLYCYDMSGNEKWTFNAGTSYATPLVYKSRVYYAAGNGNLYCLDANATGTGSTTLYWTYSGAGGASHSSPTTDGSRIFYTKTHTSGLQAVWISNGTKAWNTSLDGATGTESSPSYWNNMVYVGAGESYGSGNNNLYAIYANNGTIKWKYNAGSVIATTPSVEYGNVYFGTYNGRVFCLDATGKYGSTTKIWEYNTNSGSSGILGSTAVAYGRVYVGAVNSRVYSLDAKGSGGSTTKYWDQYLTPVGQFGVYSSPAVTEKYIYAGTSGNGFYCLNRASGSTVWSNTFSTATYGISMSPVVYKKNIILCSDNGNLYVIKADLSSPKIVSTDPQNGAGDVFIGTNITVTFNEKLDTSTLTSASVKLEDSQSNSVSGKVTSDMSPGVFKAFFTPDSNLQREETFTLTVTTDVTDFRGNSLDGNGNGNAEGPGVDEFSFSFTTVPNAKPIFNDIPKLDLVEDVPYTINLTTYLSDADTPMGSLEISENSTYVSLSGLDMTFLYPEGVHYDLVNITVSDNIFTIYKEVVVKISAVNDLPVIAYIPGLFLKEDISFELNMEDYITDVDTPISDLRVIEYAENVEVSGMIINFTYPEGITSDVVNITVYDQGYSVYRDIHVTIEPVNDAPVLKEIPAVYVTEDIESTISFEKYVSDIDTAKEALEFIVESPYVTVQGFKLRMLYPNGILHDSLTIKLFDGELYATQTLEVNIDPVNDPPEIISVISPEDGKTYEYNASIDFIANVYDQDLKYGDSLEFKWTVDQVIKIAETQNATGVVLEPGPHTVSFTVTDSGGSSVNHKVNVIVKEKEGTGGKPGDPGPAPDVDNKNVSKTSEPKESSLMTLAVIIIVVIIVFVIAIAFIMMKKKKDKAVETPVQSELTAPYQQPGVFYPTQQQFPMQQQPFPAQYPMQQPQQYPQMEGFGQPGFQDFSQGYPQTFDQSQFDQNQYWDQTGAQIDQNQIPEQQPFFQDQMGGEQVFPQLLPPDPNAGDGTAAPALSQEQEPATETSVLSFDKLEPAHTTGKPKESNPTDIDSTQ